MNVREGPWQANFIKTLWEAASPEIQRQAWLEGGIPGFPDPGELICQLFDDSAIDDQLLVGSTIFSESTDAQLRRLSELASKVEIAEPPLRLLASDSWQKFVLEAGQTLEMVMRDLGREIVDEGGAVDLAERAR